jgi:hypothetical protein
MIQLSLVITAILAAIALSVIAIPLVYAQESETEKEVNNIQKGVSSGESSNVFCSKNFIDSGNGISNQPLTCLSGTP